MTTKQTLSPVPTFLLLIAFFFVLPHGTYGDDTISAIDSELMALQNRLVEDGLKREFVSRHFTDERFEVFEKLLNVNIRQPDGTAGYTRFKGETSIIETKTFLEENRERIMNGLGESHVDPEVVVAILQVESNLGKDHGKHRLMNVFASLALLNTDNIETIAPNFWDKVLKDTDPTEETELRKVADKRAKRKARWAYRELLTLLTMAEKGIMDPLDTRGSWAGAFGMSQFLPTSFEAYARDGDSDGVIDLYHLEDAVASVANYLSRHGYRTDNLKKRKKAIYSYNHSDDYVDCVITLANAVKESSTSP
ncbi:lytic murein transglycosylase [bacterium]|nr:lytic murein transglycosylase [bacterium]